MRIRLRIPYNPENMRMAEHIRDARQQFRYGRCQFKVFEQIEIEYFGPYPEGGPEYILLEFVGAGTILQRDIDICQTVGGKHRRFRWTRATQLMTITAPSLDDEIFLNKLLCCHCRQPAVNCIFEGWPELV